MAEQDDATTMGNIELAIAQAVMDARTVTVGKVIAYREIGPNKTPVVDVQIAPKRAARPVDGNASETKDIPILRNTPVGYWLAGDMTIQAQLKPGQHVLIIICDRELSTWMRGDGETYRQGFPGISHDINDAIALPFLTPERFQVGVRPGPTELRIGDKTGQLCSIVLDSAKGSVTVKGSATVNVEAPVVTIGSAGTQAPIARIGDQVIVPPGGAGGTFPITPGIPFGLAPSVHTVKG